jgi:hypothetical protein
MKQPSVYVKMRVLGAVDTVAGRTRHQRILNVAAMTFLDEEGQLRQFTWRTIQTWFYRYKNHGITGMTNHARKDKGTTRKVTPEELLEALNAARPHFHSQRTNKRALYRFCIEHGLLQPGCIGQTTFYRFIREYDLLAPQDQDCHLPRFDRILGRILPNCHPIAGCLLRRQFGKKGCPQSSYLSGFLPRPPAQEIFLVPRLYPAPTPRR